MQTQRRKDCDGSFDQDTEYEEDPIEGKENERSQPGLTRPIHEISKQTSEPVEKPKSRLIRIASPIELLTDTAETSCMPASREEFQSLSRTASRCVSTPAPTSLGTTDMRTNLLHTLSEKDINGRVYALPRQGSLDRRGTCTTNLIDAVSAIASFSTRSYAGSDHSWSSRFIIRGNGGRQVSRLLGFAVLLVWSIM